MSPERHKNFGNNHQAARRFSRLKPMQHALETRLAAYSRQHVVLPENLNALPMVSQSGTTVPHGSTPLVNKLIDFLDYLVGDRFAVSQLVGYQGEMVFLLPFRGMHSNVFNVNVDTSLSLVENLFLQYFRVWQQQASTLNMVTRIQQTGTLADTPLSDSSGALRLVNVLPQSWQIPSGVPPSGYPTRKALVQNLSAIYNALHQFEYNRLNRYLTGFDLHTFRERSREVYGQLRDAVFVIASAAQRFGRPQNVTAYEKTAGDESPSGAQRSFAWTGQPGQRGLITVTQNLAQFAEYVATRSSTEFTSLLHGPKPRQFVPVSGTMVSRSPMNFMRSHTDQIYAESGTVIRDTALQRSDLEKPQASTRTAIGQTEYAAPMAHPLTVSAKLDLHHSILAKIGHPAIASLWPRMILNLHHWLDMMEQIQEISRADRAGEGTRMMPFSLLTVKTTEPQESLGSKEFDYGSVVSRRNGRTERSTETDTEEVMLRRLTFIRAAEPVREAHHTYTYAHTIKPAMKDQPASYNIQQKEVVNLVRKEVETALKAQSPMEHLTRVELTRLADQVYSSLVRRLVIEKERLSG